MKKAVFIVISIVLFFALVPVRASAQSQSEWDAKIAEYQRKIDESQKQATSLSSLISQFDDSMRLTEFKIESRKSNIAKLSLEIDELSSQIDRLDITLKTMIARTQARIPYIYKQRQAQKLGLWFIGDSVEETLLRIKYYEKVEKDNSETLKQLFETQRNFSERKSMREKKKDQQDESKRELEKENITLLQQKKAKQHLLTETKNSEANYRRLLDEAKAQAAAFKGFVSSGGFDSVLQNQTSCSDWGCYYNQRDAKWAYYTLGRSKLSVLEYGCLVSSVAMVAKHYGKDITPADIASDSSAFFSPDQWTGLLWNTITIKGLTIQRNKTSTNTATIDALLSTGHPVIVGVYGGPKHFIVLKSGSNGNYVMNDPLVENGHDIAFSTRYHTWDITEVSSVSFP